MTDDRSALVYRIADRLKALAESRGRDPFTAAVELLIILDSAGMQKWADDGFPIGTK